MSTGPVSRFPVVPPEQLPEELRERYVDVQERSGFLPNVFAALSWRPAEAAAFFALHDALMDKDTPGLSTADRELIVVATSAANACLYCVVAHGAILRVRAKDPLLPDLLSANWRTAPVTARQAAMLRYAVTLSTTPELVTDDDLAELRRHGFSDDDIWDIGAVTALFALSNRLAHAMDLQPNGQFHLLGRLPREDRTPPHPDGRRPMSTPQDSAPQHDARQEEGDPRTDPAAMGEARLQEPDGDGGAAPTALEDAGEGSAARPPG